MYIVLTSTTSEGNNRNHACPAWGGPCGGCPGCLAFSAGLGAGPDQTQPTASNIGRPPRPNGLGASRPDGAPVPFCRGRRTKLQACPAKPASRHQPAQGAAAKAPKETAKPGPRMSTTNLKQGACNCAQLQGSNTTGRRHRHTPHARETGQLSSSEFCVYRHR